MRLDTSSDLKSLLEENLKISKAVLVSSEKTRKVLKWMKIMSILRLLLIVVPLVLALLYLPPFLSSITKNLGGITSGEQLKILNQVQNLNPSIIEQLKAQFGQ